MEFCDETYKPCPFCGSTSIGVKDTIVDLMMDAETGAAKREIWAYCRRCQATSGHITAVVTTDEEEENLAIQEWNKRAREP